jgi:hypothetical protein
VVDATLVELLEAGVAEGIFDVVDAHFTGRVILGMLGGIVDWYDDGPSSAEEIADGYVRSALKLVLPPGAGKTG